MAAFGVAVWRMERQLRALSVEGNGFHLTFYEKGRLTGRAL
jgi:hypothetical protein